MIEHCVKVPISRLAPRIEGGEPRPTTGRIEIHGVSLGPRDGAAISDESPITITAIDETEIVLVEVA